MDIRNHKKLLAKFLSVSIDHILIASIGSYLRRFNNVSGVILIFKVIGQLCLKWNEILHNEHTYFKIIDTSYSRAWHASTVLIINSQYIKSVLNTHWCIIKW